MHGESAGRIERKIFVRMDGRVNLSLLFSRCARVIFTTHTCGMFRQELGRASRTNRIILSPLRANAQLRNFTINTVIQSCSMHSRDYLTPEIGAASKRLLISLPIIKISSSAILKGRDPSCSRSTINIPTS